MDMGDDPAVLRRLLVDAGWFEHDATSQVYRPTERCRALWDGAAQPGTAS
jgi:hypothetical protein